MELFKPEPIPQVLESANRTHQIVSPFHGYSRSVSPSLLSYCSEFYATYLTSHGVRFSSRCAHCHVEHSAERLCLPNEYPAFAIDCLIDLIERTPQGPIPPSLLFSVIRLCGYLLIKPRFIFAMIQLYIPSHFRRPSAFMSDFVQVLSDNSYPQIANYFSATYLKGSS